MIIENKSFVLYNFLRVIESFLMDGYLYNF